MGRAARMYSMFAGLRLMCFAQYPTTVRCGLGRFGLQQFTGSERRKEVIVVLIPVRVYVCVCSKCRI